VLVVAAALWVAGPAAAEIEGFEVTSITSSDDSVALDSRLGTSSTASEHAINIEDCREYGDGSVTVDFAVDMSNYSGYGYGVAVALPSETCPTDAIDFASAIDTECVTIENKGVLDTTFEAEVGFEWLTGGDCDAGFEAKSTIYVVISDEDAANAESEEIVFLVDLLAPASPTIEELLPGDERIEVVYDDSVNDADSDILYTIYWSTEPIDDDPSSEVSSATTTSSTYEIEDGTLINGQTYYVRMSATDAYDNQGPLSNEVSTEPVPTEDFWEAYKAAGGTDPGGFCFIATAAYGSPMGADLDVLRAFRDQVLWPTALGRSFVRGYYDWGRVAARWIADKPTVRAVVRVALAPLVWLGTLTTAVGPPMAALLLLLCFVLLAVVARRWRPRMSTASEVTR
jgi:hypothetical protein